MRVDFHKMHGLGNDFVIIDGRETPVTMTPAAARAIADRNEGIGCDQLILLSRSSTADVKMQIWNPDGSEVSACGNATRCVAALLGGETRIETAASLLHATIDGDGASVDMGVPRFSWDEIPLAMPVDTRAMPVAWDTLERPVAVNIGNPHVVFFVTDIAAIPLDTLGPRIEHDAMFPERINVNIAQILAPDHLAMRTWERGAGPTRACGTGACAVYAAARRTNRIPGPAARIDLPGGTLVISEADGRIQMTGPASHVFSGHYEAATFA